MVQKTLKSLFTLVARSPRSTIFGSNLISDSYEAFFL
jgi:hypothetical protein